MKPSDLIPTQDIDALVKLAHVARREGDRAAALAAFEAAAAANPTRVGLKAEVASELRKLGRLDEAEALLRQALAIDPQHVTRWPSLDILHGGEVTVRQRWLHSRRRRRQIPPMSDLRRSGVQSCASLGGSMRRKCTSAGAGV